jgi:hypothetical protein
MSEKDVILNYLHSIVKDTEGDMAANILRAKDLAEIRRAFSMTTVPETELVIRVTIEIVTKE